jgi:predicted nucleic acid-binding protein
VITYVDSSVILRSVLGQSDAIHEWKSISAAVTSALVEVECLRSLDRVRLGRGLGDRQITSWREAIFRLLTGAEVVEVSRPILVRAAQPMPTALGTLDAIHLATALLWRERGDQPMAMATHDGALATAARAHGFEVLGA